MADVEAFFSPCRTWRYSLTRDVAPPTGEGTVVFVGLNPSTADETNDDPTVRRMIGFARSWGFARLKVLNVFAFRSTDPAGLLEAEDPVGPENMRTAAKVIGGADLVVCAWGALPSRERQREWLGLIAAPHCLGLTKNGSPRHPLYVPSRVLPQGFAHCPTAGLWRRVAS